MDYHYVDTILASHAAVNEQSPLVPLNRGLWCDRLPERCPGYIPLAYFVSPPATKGLEIGPSAP